MGREIGLVCFDLGGVIIRHYRSWSQACAGLGVAPGVGGAAGLVSRICTCVPAGWGESGGPGWPGRVMVEDPGAGVDGSAAAAPPGPLGTATPGEGCGDGAPVAAA